MSGNQNVGCAIVATLLLFVLFGLFVVGIGSFFFLRPTGIEVTQALPTEEASFDAEVALQLQEALAAPADAVEVDPPTSLTTRIALAADGSLQRDGEDHDWDQLRAHLRATPDAEWVVEVDPECSFQKLSELLQVFAEAGVAQPLLRIGATP